MYTYQRFLKSMYAIALLLALIGCDDEKKAKYLNAETSVDSESLNFIEIAGEGGLAEISIAKLALKNASDPRVRAFATMMLVDHGRAAAALNALCDKRLVTPVTMLSLEHQQTLVSLNKLSGVEFDRRYMQQMVQDHQKAVPVFENASHDRVTAVQEYANKYLPTMRTHLNEAKRLNAGL